METALFGGHTIGLACSACGQKIARSVAGLKANDEFPCPQCDRPVRVDAQHLLPGPKSLNEAVFAITFVRRMEPKRQG